MAISSVRRYFTVSHDGNQGHKASRHTAVIARSHGRGFAGNKVFIRHNVLLDKIFCLAYYAQVSEVVLI
jgi:hypothetical protein